LTIRQHRVTYTSFMRTDTAQVSWEGGEMEHLLEPMTILALITTVALLVLSGLLAF
jgi:hypothetical protein